MAIIQTVPNQWVLTINKDAINEDTLYARFNMSALDNACKDLNAGALKLWIYLSKNQDGYTFALSPSDIKEKFNMGKTQYDNARKELLEKGYIVIERGRYYKFYETPPNITEEELQAKYQASRDWEDANRHYREFMKDVKEMEREEERKWEEYRKKFGQFNNY